MCRHAVQETGRVCQSHIQFELFDEILSHQLLQSTAANIILDPAHVFWILCCLSEGVTTHQPGQVFLPEPRITLLLRTPPESF